MTDPSRNFSEASSSEATRKEIAKALAPVVWLHKDNDYRPSSVDWYLARASLEYSNNKNKIEAIRYFEWVTGDCLREGSSR